MAKENVWRPEPRSTVIGCRKRPNEWRVPSAMVSAMPPQIRMTAGVRQFLEVMEVTISRDCSLSKPARRLRLQRERIEIRVAIVIVFVLRAFQPADDFVGHRREHDFDADLDDELRQHHERQLV